MSATDTQAIPPDTVHKEHEEDVLVSNARQPLPAFIDERLLDASTVDDADRALLRRFYRRAAGGADVAPTRLYLRSLPLGLSTDRTPGHAAVEAEVVRRYYSDHDGSLMPDAEFVDEVDEVQLMRAFVAREHHLSDWDRVLLSNVFSRLTELRRPRTVYVNLVIDTSNYFFFRRHQEHVPGIMLIEAARQAMYVHYHQFSRWTRAQAAFTIDSLGMQFHRFVELNLPVRIRVEELAQAEARSAGERVERVATFYQANALAAVATLHANVIKKDLFKRMRNGRSLVPGSRFLPVKNIARTMAFVSPGGGRLEGTLLDISAAGIGVVFDGCLSLEPAAGFDFLMFVDTIGLIAAKVALCWTQRREGGTAAGFRIVEMQSDCSRRLRETIRNFTFLNTRRDAV